MIQVPELSLHEGFGILAWSPLAKPGAVSGSLCKWWNACVDGSHAGGGRGRGWGVHTTTIVATAVGQAPR